MKGREDSQGEETATDEKQNRMRPQFKEQSSDSGKRQRDLYLGCLTKQQLIIISVVVGLAVLLIIFTVTAVVLTPKSSAAHLPFFSTGEDMLDFLVQSGEISRADGLLATWFHRANSKEDMNKALASDAMILEADVTLEGYGTPGEKPVPIMAHPPDIYSDNTLDQWLDAVLASRKGVKLDFKTLESVGLSLDLLDRKNSSSKISRPVWINADILQGPNIPDFVPAVNGTRFLQLIQEKFPDVTVSPGWKVLHAPPLFTGTYTRPMVEDMYNMIQDVPQLVTFPVHALLVRRGWQHISWLLSQSPRFSLTLWQGSIHPNVSDLLFVRDNAHPARVYYDIYEPTLSEFKRTARQRHRLKRFYPGGDLMDFLYPTHSSDTSFLPTQHDSLTVQWFTVTDRASLLAYLSDNSGGMLVVQVDSLHSEAPSVKGSGKRSEVLMLQAVVFGACMFSHVFVGFHWFPPRDHEDVLQLLGQNAAARWGVYLRVHTQQLLEASLRLLHSVYCEEKLYRPVWISVEGSQSGSNTKEFVSAVERLFPYVTLVLTAENWPQLPAAAAATGLSQRIALHLNGASMPKGQEDVHSLIRVMDSYDLIVEENKNNSTEAFEVLKGLVAQRGARASTHLYVISNQ